MARTGGYGDRRQRQAVAVAAALAAAVATGGYSGGGRLWRRRKEQLQQSQVGVKIFCAGGMGKPLNMDCAKFCAAQPVNPLF